jgi:hypothetical protein
MKLKFANALSLALIMAMFFTSVGLASDVAVAVVDVTAPTGSVTLQPGQTGPIVINLTVSGQQDGTATFSVYRNWTLSGGVFSGSNPQTFTVPAGNYTGSNPRWTSSTNGTVTIAVGETTETKVLAVSAFGITNSNTSGAKLGDGADSNYQVTVSAPPPPANTAPTLTLPGNQTAEATSASGAVVSYTVTASDAQDGSLTPSCSPASGSTFPLGTTTVNCSVTDSGGMSASGSFSVTVQDTTAPSLTLPGSPTVEATSPAGATVTFSASASDLVSGPVAVNCLPASGTTFNFGTTPVSCSATDGAGNTATGGFSVLVQDTIAPTINGAPDRTPDSNGWYNADVTVTFTCNDSGSGIASCSAPTTLSSDGADQSVTGTATDVTGNTASATVSNIDIDKTAPVVTATASPAPNANGWNNTDVVVAFSGSDTLSGMASCDPNVVLNSEGAGQSATGSCADQAGNSASATASNINIDKTAPSVALVDGPANGASYYFGSVPALPTCNASDATSGLAGPCSVSGYGTTVGTHTVTASAIDNAGNSASASATYTVLAWTLNGFYSPVDMNGVFNTVKGGSTVPLKFEVLAGTTELTAISVVKSFTVTQISCNASAPIDDIELVTTGGTSLRYDATGGQFVQNWQTPRAAGSCYRVTMTTQDGSSLVAFFKLK